MRVQHDYRLRMKRHRAQRSTMEATMLYMLKVYVLVALPVFGLAGAVILAMVTWSEIQKGLRAVKRLFRTSSVATRESVVISRTIS
jgi:hypothetical protein